ncbi:uncharacterized protein PV07_00843 [Cladophialophora immunda]|uniref:Uncharacterized protein n=1 Tax=Cladophialophora immunda TaxID=569365 RepID=A0A0D2A0Y0_9EURO|nr:uncharacterized protein PV07_00843 [Cladophialophora immunda]KIW34041.1 hypothetical protein PV07_00843 [Cladophialophora immunda]
MHASLGSSPSKMARDRREDLSYGGQGGGEDGGDGTRPEKACGKLRRWRTRRGAGGSGRARLSQRQILQHARPKRDDSRPRGASSPTASARRFHGFVLRLTNSMDHN